jgi:hypothetical protein
MLVLVECLIVTGSNKLDQIKKIHNIIGTPSIQLLEKMTRSVFFIVPINHICLLPSYEKVNSWLSNEASVSTFKLIVHKYFWWCMLVEPGQQESLIK